MKKFVALFVLALLGATLVIGLSIYDEQQKTRSEDPRVWEEAIAAFEAEDLAAPAPANAIIFTGSSSIRLWHSLEQDMAPLAVVKRGFGGARAKDLAFYTERLITHYQPRAVVISVGANDLLVNDDAEQAVADIRQGMVSTLATIRSAQPQVDVFYIAITRSIALAERREALQAANRAVEELLANDPHGHFIRTRDMFLDEKGEPEEKLFQFDGLHLSQEGYQLWTGRIRPLLEALQYPNLAPHSSRPSRP